MGFALLLALPAAAAAATSFTGTVGGCDYDVTPAATSSGFDFQASVTCAQDSVADASLSGSVSKSEVQVTSASVKIQPVGASSGVTYTLGIDKSFALAEDSSDSGQQDAFWRALAQRVTEVLGVGETFQSIASDAQNAAGSDLDNSDTGWASTCASMTEPPSDNQPDFCQDSNTPSPDLVSASQSLITAQWAACPAIRVPVPGLFIVCIPTFLQGGFNAGSRTILVTPGGLIAALPIGTSLSTPTTPVLSTSSSVIVAGGMIAGYNLNVKAGGDIALAGSTILTAHQLTLTAGRDVSVGHVDTGQLLDFIPPFIKSWLPSSIDLSSGASIDAPALIFGGAVKLKSASLHVGASSAISTNGMGNPGGDPGAPSGEAIGGAKNGFGGSHGGLGSHPFQWDGTPGAGATGDSVTNPSTAGNGGASGAAGGGVISVNTGTMAIDGEIRANGDGTGCPSGAPDGCTYGGGGSGGTIALTGTTLAGSGRLTADGGNSDTAHGASGGAGGGGRIAIHYDSSSGWTGAVHAFGGRDTGNTRVDQTPAGAGGAGTVFWQQSNPPSGAPPAGHIVIDAGGGSDFPPPDQTPLGSGWNNANRDLSIQGRATATGTTVQFRNIALSGNGLLTLPPPKHTLTVNASSVSVDGSSRIDVSGFGDKGGVNTGSGTSQSPAGSGLGSKYGSGGSHGGLGGESGYWSKPSGPVYDDATNPLLPGAGGGGASNATNANGEPGGGALVLTADTLDVASGGRVLADGRATDGPTTDDPMVQSTDGGGAGAGGAVNLTVTTLNGAGTIAADGGDSCLLSSKLLPGAGGCLVDDSSGGGGGGGMVAVRYSDNSGWSGLVHAFGGHDEHAMTKSPPALLTDINSYGAAGTVFWLASTDPSDGGSLIVDQGGTDNGVVSPAATPLEDSLASADRSLTVAHQARATAVNATYQSLSVLTGGDLTLPRTEHTLTVSASSVNVDGTSRIDVSGRGDKGGTGGQGTSGASQSPAGSGLGSKYGSGGSHAGSGGESGHFSKPSGTVYDVVTNPTLPGAGGGGDPTANDANGEPGGGVLMLTAGMLDVASGGRILADGRNTDGPTADHPEPVDPSQPTVLDSNGGGAGAGGAVNLTVTSLSGGGTISADGGDSCLLSSKLLAEAPQGCLVNTSSGGGGGGGMVSVRYSSDSAWSGSVHAVGGHNEEAMTESPPALIADVSSYGAAGTVFWLASTDPADGGSLVVDEGGTDTGVVSPAATPLDDSLGSPNRSLTVGHRARATAVNPSYKRISVVSGADLTLPSTEHTLTVNAPTLTVGSSARIDVSAGGDAPGTTDAPSGVISKNGAGGSHGGLGGAGTAASTAKPGDTYDDPNAPSLPGAGGSKSLSNGNDHGQPGGGVLLITATTLTDNGKILADGLATDGPTALYPVIYDNVGGGGAGGSVQVHTHALAGGGAISADGGNACLPKSGLLADPNSAGCAGAGPGAGGGGRVLVSYGDISNWTGSITAAGGVGKTGSSADKAAAMGAAGSVVKVLAP